METCSKLEHQSEKVEQKHKDQAREANKEAEITNTEVQISPNESESTAPVVLNNNEETSVPEIDQCV